MAFVLDSSVALAWLLPDESSQSTDALANRLEREAAVVPAIWPLEVGNALLMAQRRGRLTEKELGRLLSVIADLPVEIEPGALDERLSAVMSLARKLGHVTICDNTAKTRDQRAFKLLSRIDRATWLAVR